jgi:DNA adenine methylase
LRPLLKWAGGKSSLVKRIRSLLPRDLEKRGYHEPFVGGGALFFSLEPGRGSINDVNPRLMNFYRVVRDHPEELIEEASVYRYDEREYYRLRDRFNSGDADEVEDAAILIYLNRTGYNGLYRVNSKGEFNVPFGRYDSPTIIYRNRVLKASKALKNIEIRSEDFTYVLDPAKEGDICYLDPPYHPASRTANFTDYAAGGFRLGDHARLRDLCVRLNEKGVVFVQSNSDTNYVRSLYEDTSFKLFSLRTNRMLSSKVSSRSKGYDLLITNSSQAW